jgi:hypothetical protein
MRDKWPRIECYHVFVKEKVEPWWQCKTRTGLNHGRRDFMDTSLQNTERNGMSMKCSKKSLKPYYGRIGGTSRVPGRRPGFVEASLSGGL